MIKGLQKLVNAQVSVNRAVFEGNYPFLNLPNGDRQPDKKYLLECINQAIKELSQAREEISGQLELFDNDRS